MSLTTPLFEFGHGSERTALAQSESIIYGLRMSGRLHSIVFLLFGAGFLISCTTQHEITHKVEPVQITVDVNVQVQEELNDFFGELDAASETVEYQESEVSNES